MMELLEAAKEKNDFGLRKRFPWSGYTRSGHWTGYVSNGSEKDFVKSLLGLSWESSFDVKRVENPYLWARYVLRHEELKALDESNSISEEIVIHSTSSTNANNIAGVNFDWRRAHRCRFGQGVSFSRDAWYAHQYASGKSCYIIAGINRGKSTIGGYGTIIPPEGYDTTMDSRNHVYVKYYDDDFYPYYIVE